MTQPSRPSLSPTLRTTTIGILIFDDVEELDFVGPLEVFGMAQQFGANCETLVTAEESQYVADMD